MKTSLELLLAAHQQKKQLEAELLQLNNVIELNADLEWQRLVAAIQQDSLTAEILDREFGQSIPDIIERSAEGMTLYHCVAIHAKKTAEVIIPWLIQHNSILTLAVEYDVLKIAIANKNWNATLSFVDNLKNVARYYMTDVLFGMAEDFPTSKHYLDTLLQRVTKPNSLYRITRLGLSLLQYACSERKGELAHSLLQHSEIDACQYTTTLNTTQHEVAGMRRGIEQDLPLTISVTNIPPLLLACRVGAINIIKALFDARPHLPTVYPLKLEYKTYVAAGDGLADTLGDATDIISISALHAAVTHQQWLCIPILLTHSTNPECDKSLLKLMRTYPAVFAEQTHPLLMIVQSAALEYFYKTRNDLWNREGKHVPVNSLLIALSELGNEETEILKHLKTFCSDQKKIKDDSFSFMLMHALLKDEPFCQSNRLAREEIIRLLKPDAQFAEFCYQFSKKSVELITEEARDFTFI